MAGRNVRVVLVVVGFVVAAAVVGVTSGLIEDRTEQTWVRWPLMAVVIVPVVFLLLRYLGGRGRVPAGEKAWVASVPVVASTSLLGRIASVGGVLVLESDAVIFRPLAWIGRTRRYPLDSVVAVKRFADRPPRLRVEFDDGRAGVFIVPATPLSPFWSRDTTARDQAVGEIGSRLGAVREGS